MENQSQKKELRRQSSSFNLKKNDVSFKMVPSEDDPLGALINSESKKDGMLAEQPSLDSYGVPPIHNMTSLTSINYN